MWNFDQANTTVFMIGLRRATQTFLSTTAHIVTNHTYRRWEDNTCGESKWVFTTRYPVKNGGLRKFASFLILTDCHFAWGLNRRPMIICNLRFFYIQTYTRYHWKITWNNKYKPLSPIIARILLCFECFTLFKMTGEIYFRQTCKK